MQPEQWQWIGLTYINGSMSIEGQRGDRRLTVVFPRNATVEEILDDAQRLQWAAEEGSCNQSGS